MSLLDLRARTGYGYYDGRPLFGDCRQVKEQTRAVVHQDLSVAFRGRLLHPHVALLFGLRHGRASKLRGVSLLLVALFRLE
jgi:hypothetical protein